MTFKYPFNRTNKLILLHKLYSMWNYSTHKQTNASFKLATTLLN